MVSSLPLPDPDNSITDEYAAVTPEPAPSTTAIQGPLTAYLDAIRAAFGAGADFVTKWAGEMAALAASARDNAGRVGRVIFEQVGFQQFGTEPNAAPHPAAEHGGRAWDAWLHRDTTEIAERIRLAAYYRYLSRGDLPGDPLDDWLAAQQQVLGVAISERAYELWEHRADPGTAEQDWLQAEREALHIIGVSSDLSR